MWQWLFKQKELSDKLFLEFPWRWWRMNFWNEGPKKRTWTNFWFAYCVFFLLGEGCAWKVFSIDSNVIILSAQKYRLTICAIDITKFYRFFCSETIFQNSYIIWSWSVNIHAIGHISTYSVYKNFFLLWCSVAYVGLCGSANFFFHFLVWTCLSISLSLKKSIKAETDLLEKFLSQFSCTNEWRGRGWCTQRHVASALIILWPYAFLAWT